MRRNVIFQFVTYPSAMYGPLHPVRPAIHDPADFSGQSQFGQTHRHLSLHCIHIEDTHCRAAIRHFLYPYLIPIRADRLSRLFSQHILIDGQHLVIGQQVQGERVQFTDITPYQQRRRQQTP